MDTIGKRIRGVVLSGGQSKRMGQEKGLVEFRGKKLVEYPVEALQPLCSEVVISTSHSGYGFLQLPLVEDLIPNCGPLGGIYSCMMTAEYDFFLVLSCDIPFANTGFLKYLLSEASSFDAVVPVDGDGRVQPLCAYYRRSCLSTFQEALSKSDFKMMNVLGRLSVKYLQVSSATPFYDSRMFFNVNSPAELDGLGESF